MIYCFDYLLEKQHDELALPRLNSMALWKQKCAKKSQILIFK